ncbi:unnamed protein product [Prorocentrum cordatum]|uniref:RAP domain-containing protein n=1 Tax=Prorocentrum cordatum TaxID=2364126 RepID=A0ABN9Y8Z3_9DINO|nr:unnamed protein product [Polarella glacialis]
MDLVEGEVAARPLAGQSGGWRERLHSRRQRGDDADCAPGAVGARGRSERGQQPDGVAFDQRSVLDQDKALIEQLTQRQQPRERPPVKKPTPPPKVAPYRGATLTPGSNRAGSLVSTTFPSRCATPDVAPVDAPAQGAPPMTAAVEALAPSPAACLGEQGAPLEATPPLPAAADARCSRAEVAAAEQAAAVQLAAVATPAPQQALEPVVPRTGHLFTGADIDSLMDRLDPAGAQQPAGSGLGGLGAPPVGGAADVGRGDCTQNFEDISREFFRDHRLPAQAGPEAEGARGAGPAAAAPSSAVAAGEAEFEVPQRRELKEQIRAIDSWLEDDFSARERLGDVRGGGMARTMPLSSVQASVADPSPAHLAATVALGEAGKPEAEVFRKLEEAKRRKAVGEQASPILMKEAAAQAKPLLPSMSLDKLCRVLRLFCSARHEDHDLYLRILGEIPVQVRGITPEQLTDCVRVMCRLRLQEETYLELFSMEAMNMIRAGSRRAVRAPRRPPAPSRKVDAAAMAAASDGSGLAPVAPLAGALAPFTATQLIQLGNALSQLDAKHNARFLDVFQEQLSVAIPRLTLEECELVSPTMAMSQLMPDALRRSFLERCMRVDAGRPLEQQDNRTAAPDIAEFQRDAQSRRRRAKHFHNVFVIEACVRKDTFSFFSSLPADVRAYLDRVRTESGRLEHEGPSFFASQIAAVLDQLGVVCDMRRMAGPLGLHIVTKATNPNAQTEEIVYECSDESAYYAVRQDDRTPPELTASSKLRHRLLQRLKVQVVHVMSVREWQQLGEAQRVNYMVKLQSLQ